MRGIGLGKGRVYTLAYADMVLMAEGEDEMRSMMERLEKYLEKKKVELNPDKTNCKIVRFRKEGGRERRNGDGKGEGNRGGKRDKISLRVRTTKNGGQEAQIKDRGKKAVLGRRYWGRYGE